VSRYMWVVLLDVKAAVVGVIKCLQAAVEVECGRKLRVLRTTTAASSQRTVPTRGSIVTSPCRTPRSRTASLSIATRRCDEDITTLDTPTLWSSPSSNSSPTQLPRHPRIQQTHHHCFGHNSLIRHRNEAFLDALERGRRRRRFGSGPSSIRFVDHSV
jgi:hypothetical protein